jgi:adenylate cyclase
MICHNGGMVADIVGDALYVIFNAPLSQPEHAAKAVAAALELDRFCCDFQAAKQAEGINLDVTRIGINTGPGVVGNFGGSQRLEYTAMGDGINTAARLESVNKHLGTRICISDATVVQSSEVEFRPVGCLLLKGKTNVVKTFTPVLDESAEFVEAYAAACQRLSVGEATAVTLFRELAKTHPDDALVNLHNTRLENGASHDIIIMDEK